MTLKSYIWGMRFVTLFSIAGLAAVVYFVDPEAGPVGKILFYFILFFALSGILNLIFLRLRRGITTSETAFANVGMSLRQAMILSFFAIGLLILQSFRVLVWWDGLLLLAGIFLVELYFLSKS